MVDFLLNMCIEKFASVDYLRTAQKIHQVQDWSLNIDTRKATSYLDHFCTWMYSAYVRRYFQRWIIFAHKQVPRDMDVFCVRRKIFLKMILASNVFCT